MVVVDNATRALRAGGGAVLDQPPRDDFATPMERFRPGQQLLSYELGPRIGMGGMGAVYQATHVWLGRQVAIKFIAPELMSEPETIARFTHEARAIGALDHPHIVRATDAGRAGNTHFLVTEFIDGIDLAQLVKRCGPLGVAEACEMIRQAALGLQHAHDQGLVHRDVKPSNLLVDRSGQVKIVDFGLARIVAGQTTLTGTGQVLGTLDYLAPEQASDARQVSIRSDIYSLGCTLYFLLSGSPPFSGRAYETAASKIKAHLADTPPPLDRSRRKLPRGLMPYLEQMMAKSPNDRPASPSEVAAALTSYCRGPRLAALVAGELPRLPVAPRPRVVPRIAGKLLGAPLQALRWFRRRRAQEPEYRPIRSSPNSLNPLLWMAGLIFLGWALLTSGLLPIELVDEFGRPLGTEPVMSQFEIGLDGSIQPAPVQPGPHIENPTIPKPQSPSAQKPITQSDIRSKSLNKSS